MSDSCRVLKSIENLNTTVIGDYERPKVRPPGIRTELLDPSRSKMGSCSLISEIREPLNPVHNTLKPNELTLAHVLFL